MNPDKILTVAGTAIRLGSRIYREAQRFSRKKTEREQLEELARWDRPCIPLSNDHCCVCGKIVGRIEPWLCLGPPATQEARRKLQAMR